MSKKKAIDYDNIFAVKLRELLEGNEIRKKTTQQELATATGISRQTISDYASGNIRPNTDMLKKITDFFGVSADYMLGNINDVTPNFDLRAIYEDIGLSSGSVEKIKPLYGIEKMFFNYVMERDFLPEFMELFRSILIGHANEQTNLTMGKEHFRQYMAFTVTQFMTSNFDKYFNDFLNHQPLLLKTIQKAKFDFTENNNNDEVWDSIWRVVESTPNNFENLL